MAEEDDQATTAVEIDEKAIGDAPQTEEISDDGLTTTIVLEGEGKASSKEHFENLAETLPEATLDALAEKYLDLIDQDMQDRKKRDDMQAAGLEKSGISGPAPGGAGFEGASKVTHPVLIDAYIDFAAQAIKELMPPNGPVRMKVEGKPNKEKMDRAKRKAAFMNWQLTRQIQSYRPELERLLTQLPVGGSQYMKGYQNASRGCPDFEFVPIDDMVLPYHARNFFDVSRKFHRMNLSDFTFERRIASGQYRDLDLPRSYGADFERSRSAIVTDKIEGKDDSGSSGETEERIVYEGCVYLDEIGDPKAPKDDAVPYLITIDDQSRRVLSLYRNWDEGDDKYREIDYLVDFTFIPWRGIFGLSLLQCMGGLPDAMTGSLRALLDSALINNMPGAFKLKGNPSGASLSTSPTQVTEVDAMGQDDIRKIYMPIPFNPPSPMLFQLLGFLTTAANEVVGTAEEKIADAGNNMPVGTALALIEQGAKVFSAIHARMHDSQRRVLEILHRLNRDHLPEGKVKFGSDDEDYVTREDFEGSMDVRPVSDPNIFSEAQRFAQIQFVMQTLIGMGQVPALAGAVQKVDMRALLARAFEQAKIPDYEEFLPETPKAQPLNPVDENICMVMGTPVKAYAGQNHEAHIQVLLDFSKNPLFGQSPIIASKFMTPALNHLQDHILVWYEEMMKRDAANAAGKEVSEVQWDDDPQSSVLLAKSAPVVDQAAQLAFGKIPPLIAGAMQILQQNAPKPPVDPMVGVAMQDIQGKHQIAQGQLSLKQQQVQGDAQAKLALAQQKVAEFQGKMQAAQQEYDLKMKEFGINAQVQMHSAELQSQTDLAKTVHDNASAQHIAAMKLAADAHTQLSDGASLSEGS